MSIDTADSLPRVGAGLDWKSRRRTYPEKHRTHSLIRILGSLYCTSCERTFRRCGRGWLVGIGDGAHGEAVETVMPDCGAR